jgi:hypothetical protein
MPHDIQLIIALLIPFAVLVALRINAAVIFLATCLGYVLVELVAKDANSLISFLAPQAGSLSQTTWQLCMLLVPVVLASMVMLFSMKGRVAMTLNAVPAAATSALLVLLAVPLLTPGLRYAIQGEALWGHLSQAQPIIVGAGALVSLLFIRTLRHGSKHHGR